MRTAMSRLQNSKAPVILMLIPTPMRTTCSLRLNPAASLQCCSADASIASCSRVAPSSMHPLPHHHTHTFLTFQSCFIVVCWLSLRRQELGLPVNPKAPLLGFIGRLDFQKGVDLIADNYEWLMQVGRALAAVASEAQPGGARPWVAPAGMQAQSPHSWQPADAPVAAPVAAPADASVDAPSCAFPSVPS